MAAPPTVRGPGDGAPAAVPEDDCGHQPGSEGGPGGEELVVPAHVGPISRLQHILRAVAVPSVQLAGRLLAKPWEPLQEQVGAGRRVGDRAPQRR